MYFFLFDDEVSQVHYTQLLETFDMTLVFRRTFFTNRLSDDLFEVSRDHEPGSVPVDIVDPLMECRTREASRATGVDRVRKTTQAFDLG